MSVVYSFTGIFIGLFAIAAWWFAMFSDSDWGEAAREMLDGVFSLGRNTIAVVEPAVGSLLEQAEWEAKYGSDDEAG